MRLAEVQREEGRLGEDAIVRLQSIRHVDAAADDLAITFEQVVTAAVAGGFACTEAGPDVRLAGSGDGLGRRVAKGGA
ncbi:MAG: hypothetical protein WEA77_00765 [Hyphomonas sp.]|uniref:hypothetical protein n=1 Tax=Hyphomonas sp. TaxID=87 RepID=UPI0034A09EF2